MADNAVAFSNDRWEILSDNERSMRGFTHRFTIDYTDINDSSWTTDGDTVTVTLDTTDTDLVVAKCVANVTTAFATDGTLTLMVGTDGDPDNFIDAQSCLTAGPLIGAAGGVPVTEAGSAVAAGDTLVARFTTQAATGAPSDITAGSVTIFFELLELNKS